MTNVETGNAGSFANQSKIIWFINQIISFQLTKSESETGENRQVPTIVTNYQGSCHVEVRFISV